jgi:hypothetical protein
LPSKDSSGNLSPIPTVFPPFHSGTGVALSVPAEESTTSVNDNVRELLGVVAVLVLVVSLVNVMSMLFLAFTGTSTSIWIFAVPSKNVDQRSMSQ